MKRNLLPSILALTLFISLLLPGSFAIGQDLKLPKPTTEFYVADFADIINDDAESNIVRINLNYENTKEKPQIVVATIPSLQGLDENLYTVKLFEEWEIGNDEYDNGVLVLLSLEERRIKIETGYGIEGAITDAKAGRILDNSLGYLSSDDFSTGLESIFYQLAERVNEEYGYDSEVIFGNIEMNNAQQSSSDVGALGKLILVILLIIIINSGGGRGNRRRRRTTFFPPIVGPHGPGGFGGGGFGGGFGGGGSVEEVPGGGGQSGGGGAGRGF